MPSKKAAAPPRKRAKQTRRAISVRGDTYTQIQRWCKDNDTTMSQWVEDRVNEWFTYPEVRRFIRDLIEPGRKRAKAEPKKTETAAPSSALAPAKIEPGDGAVNTRHFTF